MRIRLRHNTTYRYEHSVTLGPHDVRLRPVPHCRVPIQDYVLQVRPIDGPAHWYIDAPGNWVARCLFTQPTSELSFDVELVADLVPINPFDFLLDLSAAQFPFRYPDELAVELAPSLNADSSPAPLTEWVEKVKNEFLSGGWINTVTLLVELNHRIHRDVVYQVRDEPGVQTPEQTLALGAGSCRDSSWLMIQVLRQLGLAARFVSGYAIQPEEPARQHQGGSRQTQSQPRLRADLHAWVEVYLPGGGWIGLDPTSGLMTAENHIALAVARAPSSAAPIRGSTSPAPARLSHRLEVAPA